MGTIIIDMNTGEVINHIESDAKTCPVCEKVVCICEELKAHYLANLPQLQVVEN